MKRTWTLVAIIVVLAALAVLVKIFIPEVAYLDYLFYIPLGVCAMLLFVKALAIYKGLLMMTIASIIYTFLSEGFNMDVVFPKLLWSLAGALVMFLCVYLYHLILRKKYRLE